MLTEAKSAKRAREWCEMIERALAATGVRYERLASKHLVGGSRRVLRSASSARVERRHNKRAFPRRASSGGTQ